MMAGTGAIDSKVGNSFAGQGGLVEKKLEPALVWKSLLSPPARRVVVPARKETRATTAAKPR